MVTKLMHTAPPSAFVGHITLQIRLAAGDVPTYFAVSLREVAPIPRRQFDWGIWVKAEVERSRSQAVRKLTPASPYCHSRALRLSAKLPQPSILFCLAPTIILMRVPVLLASDTQSSWFQEMSLPSCTFLATRTALQPTQPT